MIKKYARAKTGLFLLIIEFALILAFTIFLVIKRTEVAQFIKETTNIEIGKALFKVETYKNLKFSAPTWSSYNKAFLIMFPLLTSSLIVVHVLLLIVSLMCLLTSLRLGLVPFLLILLGFLVNIILLFGFLSMAKRAQRAVSEQGVHYSQRQRAINEEQY